MDPNEFSDYINGFKPDDQTLATNSEQYLNHTNGFQFNIPSPDLNFLDIQPAYPPDLDAVILTPTFTLSPDGDSLPTSSSWSPEVEESSSHSDDSDSSDPVLKYISQMLMEENMEEKDSMFHDPLALKDAEKSLYVALGVGEQCPQHPPSLDQPQLQGNLNIESPDSFFPGSNSDFGGGSSSTTTSTSTNSGTRNFVDSQWVGDMEKYNPSLLQTSLPGDYHFQFTSQPGSQFSVSQQNNLPNTGDGLVGSSINEFLIQNMFSDRESILQFNRGVEEASKFLPGGNQLVTDLESNTFTVGQKEAASRVMVGGESSPDGLSRVRKNHEREGTDLEEERSYKQSALNHMEESELSEMFDKVLLLYKTCPADGEPVRKEDSQILQRNGQSNGSNGGKTGGKKQGKKKETVDLRALLILCAQAVSSNDRRTANELLKQIRQHSSLVGDGSQRLAHCFANGLEARLAGNGTEIKNFVASLFPKKSAADLLKAYKVYLSACPYKQLSIVFANKMIWHAAEKATTLHVVDFGIRYGFQWPMLIQWLSMRSGGPPKLRVTGIELPQPGFRPAERIEETGRRLAKYCDRFKVPFEYNAIAAQHWETIQIEDIKINSNEVVAVNCLGRFERLLDETVEVNCPRNAVLNLIRKMNPAIFVNCITNGSYNAPFFVTRFREALFHFSALFDMFDVTLPRDDPERLMFEKEHYGRESMNVIACEGLERVERPETYKQWQVRTMRAGFKPLPLDPELMKKLRDKLKAVYHKDFVLDEDGHWILHGWKGRIVCATSCWAPA